MKPNFREPKPPKPKPKPKPKPNVINEAQVFTHNCIVILHKKGLKLSKTVKNPLLHSKIFTQQDHQVGR
jgi:hypothetical protein